MVIDCRPAGGTDEAECIDWGFGFGATGLGFRASGLCRGLGPGLEPCSTFIEPLTGSKSFQEPQIPKDLTCKPKSHCPPRPEALNPTPKPLRPQLEALNP